MISALIGRGIGFGGLPFIPTGGLSIGQPPPPPPLVADPQGTDGIWVYLTALDNDVTPAAPGASTKGTDGIYVYLEKIE